MNRNAPAAMIPIADTVINPDFHRVGLDKARKNGRQVAARMAAARAPTETRIVVTG